MIGNCEWIIGGDPELEVGLIVSSLRGFQCFPLFGSCRSSWSVAWQCRSGVAGFLLQFCVTRGSEHTPRFLGHHPVIGFRRSIGRFSFYGCKPNSSWRIEQGRRSGSNFQAVVSDKGCFYLEEVDKLFSIYASNSQEDIIQRQGRIEADDRGR